MRYDSYPETFFLTIQLPDHAGTPRRLSELQGDCPKEHQQHWSLPRFIRRSISIIHNIYRSNHPTTHAPAPQRKEHHVPQICRRSRRCGTQCFSPEAVLLITSAQTGLFRENIRSAARNSCRSPSPFMPSGGFDLLRGMLASRVRPRAVARASCMLATFAGAISSTAATSESNTNNGA